MAVPTTQAEAVKAIQLNTGGIINTKMRREMVNFVRRNWDDHGGKWTMYNWQHEFEDAPWMNGE